MPSTKQVGTQGPNNDKIGGIPTLHYFDFQSRGRGQVIRLLFEDAGIAYKDIRYTFDEYPEYKSSTISSLNPTANIPVIELNGKILTQSYPMLRHFARQLGSYDGKNDEEMYAVDRICDIVIDWRTLFVTAFFSPDKDKTYPEHCKTTRPHTLQAITELLESSDFAQRGPFIIGKEITYADMVLYQQLHDEELVQDGRKGLKEYKRLSELVDAVEARAGVNEFLKSERYLG